jgi:hypothetical protein
MEARQVTCSLINHFENTRLYAPETTPPHPHPQHRHSEAASKAGCEWMKGKTWWVMSGRKGEPSFLVHRSLSVSHHPYSPTMGPQHC